MEGYKASSMRFGARNGFDKCVPLLSFDDHSGYVKTEDNTYTPHGWWYNSVISNYEQWLDKPKQIKHRKVYKVICLLIV